MIISRYSAKFDGLSFSSCYLELHGPGGKETHATGFLWRHQTGVYLVTNWHVVTGKNMFTGDFVGMGWCPETIVAHITVPATGDPAETKMFDFPKLTFQLGEDYHSPPWLQHKDTFGIGIDLVLLRLSPNDVASYPTLKCVNDTPFASLLHMVGSDLFVVGYPFSRSHNRYPVQFPTWKRGSIASEPLLLWNMRPAFLADVRTSGGMSGSPVYRRVYGPAVDADLTMRLDNVLCSEFMGIYSGRLHDDENNPSIGIVWHRHLIDEIAASPSPGSRDWSPCTLPTLE